MLTIFKQQQKSVFTSVYERTLLPSSGRVVKWPCLQQRWWRTRVVCSCWASGWSGVTLQTRSPEIPKSIMLGFNKWGRVDGGARLKCSLRQWHLFGCGPGLLLLFKNLSLPGHLIIQQQSPLGHIWISRYFVFLQTQSQIKISYREECHCGGHVSKAYWLVLPELASPSSPEWTWMKSSAWSWEQKKPQYSHLSTSISISNQIQAHFLWKFDLSPSSFCSWSKPKIVKMMSS